METTMEHRDSHRTNSETASSDLAINRREVPPGDSSTENLIMARSAELLVKSFHAISILPSGAPAELPRELNGAAMCEACGRPEAEGCVVVCDGCERGFHVHCSGMTEVEASKLEEWMCRKCSGSGRRSNHWHLGWRNKRRRLGTGFALDVNGGSPQGDANGECCNSFGSQLATDSLKPQFVHPSSGAVGTSLKGLIEENNTTMGSSTKDQSATYLQDLKEYLKGKNELLAEGWRVEFDHNSVTGLLCPVYVSPDGKRLWSVSEVDSYLKSIIANMPSQCGTGKYDNGLPIQYGDFYVLSVGKVDARHSYHCENQIWPVGYSSCWHDKVTGSLFTCHVLDGGDSGPLFKVTRSPCSTLPIPDPMKILYQSKHDRTNERSYVLPSQSMDDLNIYSMLEEAPAPLEKDVLSCLGHSSNDHSNMQGSPCSTALAWRTMSNKILNVFREVYTHIGALKLLCNHALDQSKSSYDVTNGEVALKYTPLDHFYGFPYNLNIPHLIQADKEHEVVAEELLKWLDQDRFGLDAEFVQEIIEQKQDIRDIFGYVPLNKRSSFSSSITVGNGLLEVRAIEAENKDGRSTPLGLRTFNEVSIRRIDEDLSDTCSLPRGRSFSTTMPSLFLGDAIQVFEFFWRFYKLLGLKEPLTFEDIEGELMNRWHHGALFLKKVEGEIHETPFLIQNEIAGTKGHISVSSSSYGPEVDIKNPDSVVKKEPKLMEKGFPMELQLIKSSKCSGSALPMAVISMLQILISDLQTKVAAVGYLNFDISEPKKRGRKKDLDYDTTSKRNKLPMLPCNELTWPELSRRYALSMLSVNGHIDSTETTTHDTAQIFRCLQGDGGTLCGSLTGVAGIEADAWFLAEAMKRIFGSLDEESDRLAVDDDDDIDMKCLEEHATVSASVPDWVQALEPARKLPTNVGARIKRCIFNAMEGSPPEWARKILEHSISKEVYKGNASGPTKRAVLSVLERANGEYSPHMPVNEKKKKFISISGLLMKQCRLILRKAMAADQRKVCCNLLGKRISSYNSDGGTIGSPGMVSRPLDFRTIDQRLAANAYDGMHMAFYEDVCEVWNNVFLAFKEQPELLQLAENLANDFNALYEKEVVTLHQKLANCRKQHSMEASLEKMIKEILSCEEIPKAPWEDGVCKTAAIHQQPEKHHGELPHAYIVPVEDLATLMGKKEYWELNIAERTALLKFLCDELLNSALLRMHLERSAEGSVKLHQKLRFALKELKALKQRENFLAKHIDYSSLMVGSCDVAVNDYDDMFTDDAEGASLMDIDGQVHGSSSTNSSSIGQNMNVLPYEEETKGLNEVNKHATYEDISEMHAGNHPYIPNHDDIEICHASKNMDGDNLGQTLNSITNLQKQLQKVSCRGEFLGIDFAGRLYWALSNTDAKPCMVVNENVGLQPGDNITPSGSNDLRPFWYERYEEISVHSSWSCYETDSEIQKVLEFLKDDYPPERQLKESILCWQKKRTDHPQFAKSISSPQDEVLCGNNLATRATRLLGVKYGSAVELEATEEFCKQQREGDNAFERDNGIYRCKCLEPILSFKHHCIHCHQTFVSEGEPQFHVQAKCIYSLGLGGPKENGVVIKSKAQGPISECFEVSNSLFVRYEFDGLDCPYNLEDICSKFVIKDSSMKEVVAQIGLIGSKGTPTFVPSLLPHLSDPASLLVQVQDNIPCPDVNHNTEHIMKPDIPPQQFPGRIKALVEQSDTLGHKESGMRSRLESVKCLIVSNSALRPVVGGEASQILRQLKINLLDMDAALPEIALRTSKSQIERRQTWRAFVKSAVTIYEMVQALIVFEESIKSEYLSTSWWFWSSISAAVTISTLSSLALRIYSLDAAIKYEQVAAKKTKPGKKVTAKKRKDLQ
ncbi:unnamed protein product [Cuscuta campestris]|uniref:PHD-type domain-containing protein n=1 Tax=Cuscuta campestris TaxID=132261 RepID=A0A484LBA2_9ASTE|nr:unnamed protein product [Cuscuta campestris]